MNLLRALRSRGHEVRLDGMRVLVTLKAGSDVVVASRWAIEHEQELRRELVSEIQEVAGVTSVMKDAKVRKVRDMNGNEIKGAVVVDIREAKR